ncbi:MAG: VCBS repeat-containing protein [Bacteroidales bacterium]|nr:VCBS repeat-containing protein [Bacteroidales bacterium]
MKTIDENFSRNHSYVRIRLSSLLSFYKKKIDTILGLFLVISIMAISSTITAQEYSFEYNLINNGLAEISVGEHSNFEFADLDADGDLDLYVGLDDAHIKKYINDGDASFTPSTNLQADGLDINAAGSNVNPSFADMDNDGDLDLFIPNNSRIEMFINDGEGNFSTVGNIQADGTDIYLEGNSSLAWEDIGNDGDLDLFVGDFLGNVKVYLNNGSAEFVEASNLQADGTEIDYNDEIGISFADIDNDSDNDLYICNISGYIDVFSNNGSGIFSFSETLSADGTQIVAGWSAIPQFADLDDDGDLDLYFRDNSNFIQIFLNDGYGVFTTSGNVQAINPEIDLGSYSSPVFADFDTDGDLDLYAGCDAGYIKVFSNDGNANFSFESNLQADGTEINFGERSVPVLADLDLDSDLDFYIGNEDGNVEIFYNDGSGVFSSGGKLQADGSDIDVGFNSSPEFADLDNDGDLDLYVGERYGSIKCFINDGLGVFTASTNLYADGEELNIGSYSNPTFADIDNDNDLDLLVGEVIGDINIFANDGNGNFESIGTLEADGNEINCLYGKVVFANVFNSCSKELFLGNKYGTIQYFSFVDTTAPDVPIIAEVTAECSIIVNPPTANDNCGIEITGTTTDPTEYSEQGTYTINWSFVDDAGNTSTQTQNIILQDVTQPTITCTENQTIYANELDNYIVQGTEFDPGSIFDNCEIANIVNDFNSSETLENVQLEVGTHSIMWTITDEAGNSNTCTSQIIVEDFVGIDSHQSNTISVFPNPANKIVYFSFKDNYSIDILNVRMFDITGKEVYYKKSTESNIFSLDISSFKNGIYIVSIESENQISYTKIVKQ